MTYRTASGAAKAIALNLPALSIAATVALAAAPHAFAQQPSTNSLATPGTNAGQQLQLIAAPWTRYCAVSPTIKSAEMKTKEVCFTASDSHMASGEKVAIVLLIEPSGSDAKVLRVTLPLGVALIPGARIVIDQKDAMIAPYVVCLPKNGCMADYKADADLVAKLKAGHTLAIQAVDKAQPISFTLPLTDFAKAYDGPPSDPSGLDEQQKSLTNEPQPHSE